MASDEVDDMFRKLQAELVRILWSAIEMGSTMGDAEGGRRMLRLVFGGLDWAELPLASVME